VLARGHEGDTVPSERARRAIRLEHVERSDEHLARDLWGRQLDERDVDVFEAERLLGAEEPSLDRRRMEGARLELVNRRRLRLEAPELRAREPSEARHHDEGV